MGERIRFRDRSDGCPIIDIEKTRYRLVTTVIRTLYAEIRNTPRRASSRTRSRIDQHGNYLLVIANRLPPISDHPWNSINRGREWNIVAGEVVSTIDKFSSTAWFNERLERNFTRIIVTRTITTRVFPKRAFCDSFSLLISPPDPIDRLSIIYFPKYITRVENLKIGNSWYPRRTLPRNYGNQNSFISLNVKGLFAFLYTPNEL